MHVLEQTVVWTIVYLAVNFAGVNKVKNYTILIINDVKRCHKNVVDIQSHRVSATRVCTETEKSW